MTILQAITGGVYGGLLVSAGYAIGKLLVSFRRLRDDHEELLSSHVNLRASHFALSDSHRCESNALRREVGSLKRGLEDQRMAFDQAIQTLSEEDASWDALAAMDLPDDPGL